MLMVAIVFWLSVVTILYAYFGYPFLLFLISRVKAKKVSYFPIIPRLTLLIAAYNEEAVIEKKIENSLELDYPRDRLQILVVTDGSDDRTPDIVRDFANRGVELTHDPVRRGKMAAINRAINFARNEIVVFSDANNIYDKSALKKLMVPFSDPTVGCVTGAKRIVQESGNLASSEGLYWKYESFIRNQETRLGCCTGVNGEILAIRKELFVPPPPNIINDDLYIALQTIKQGYRVVYVSDARSYERVSLSPRDEMERRARIVAGRYQLMSMFYKLLPLRFPVIVWQIISHKFLRPLVPIAMIGAFLTNLLAILAPPCPTILCLGAPISWSFLTLQCIFYGFAILGNQMEYRRGIGKWFYLPTFLVNSNWAALVGFYRFLMGRQTTLWKRLPRCEGS